MIWYEDLFVADSICERKKRRIIRGIKRRSFFPQAYVLTLASNPDNLLDLISTGVLRQRGYPKKQLFVIGIAGDYEEAVCLAGQIIDGIYRARGDFCLREFFLSHKSKRGKDGLPC